MERLDEELYVEVGQLQNEQADVVGRVGTGPESRNGSSDAGLLEQIGRRSSRRWKASLRHPRLGSRW